MIQLFISSHSFLRKIILASGSGFYHTLVQTLVIMVTADSQIREFWEMCHCSFSVILSEWIWSTRYCVAKQLHLFRFSGQFVEKHSITNLYQQSQFENLSLFTGIYVRPDNLLFFFKLTTIHMVWDQLLLESLHFYNLLWHASLSFSPLPYPHISHF